MYNFLRIVLSFYIHSFLIKRKKIKLPYLSNPLTFEFLVSSLFSYATPQLLRTSEKWIYAIQCSQKLNSRSESSMKFGNTL